jgi:hypothetical protein
MTFELLWLSRPRRGTVWSRGIKSCKQKSGSIAMQSADQPPQPDPGQLLGKPWLACLLTSFKLSSTGPDPGAHSWRRSLAAGAAAGRSGDLTFFQQHHSLHRHRTIAMAQICHRVGLMPRTPTRNGFRPQTPVPSTRVNWRAGTQLSSFSVLLTPPLRTQKRCFAGVDKRFLS